MWLDGKPFFLKGASFFGMESDICVPHGLWGGDDSTTLAAVAQLLRSNGFNLVRIPLAVAAAANNITVDRYKMGNETALLKAFEGKELRYLDVLDYVVHELARHELLVLLDTHVMQPAGAITPLWYDDAQGCPESVVADVDHVGDEIRRPVECSGRGLEQRASWRSYVGLGRCQDGLETCSNEAG